MEGLLWFLVFAGVFYFMMRVGCGAHRVHGEHCSQAAEDIGSKDPVCGMPIERNKGYTKAHAGARYWFCSKNCLEKFETNPQQYLGAVAKKGLS